MIYWKWGERSPFDGFSGSKERDTRTSNQIKFNFLFIELILHLSHEKQMYSKPMHITHN